MTKLAVLPETLKGHREPGDLPRKIGAWEQVEFSLVNDCPIHDNELGVPSMKVCDTNDKSSPSIPALLEHEVDRALLLEEELAHVRAGLIAHYRSLGHGDQLSRIPQRVRDKIDLLSSLR